MPPGPEKAPRWSAGWISLSRVVHTDNGERPNKTVRETEAEAVAFVVSQAVGLDTRTALSDYIQLYAGSKATLAASLDRIQHAATGIISTILDSRDTGAPIDR